MDLFRLLAVLRRRGAWVALAALGATLIGYAGARLIPPVYSATATLLVNQTSSVGNVQLGDLMASQTLAHTYADLLTRHPVLDQTIADLHLATTPDALSAQVKVELVRDTQLLEVHVSDRDPARAAAIANDLVTVFVSQMQSGQQQSFTDVQKRLDADIVANELQLQQTQQQMDALKAVTTPDAAQQAQLTRLSGLLAQYSATRDNLMRSSASLHESEVLSGNTLEMAERAEVPTDPVFPRVGLVVALAGMLGLLLGLAVAWGREYLDDTLESAEGVQDALGLPTLAPIRHVGRAPRRGRRGGAWPAAGPAALYARDAPRADAAESYRLLRTNIEFSSVDQPPRRLLVTSAAPGEGKSTVAANLAVVLAQHGKRTLLIDADLRRPAVGRIFGLPDARGLTTLLAEGAGGGPGGEAGGAIRPAPGVPGLDLLPSGPLPPNPADLLGSARLAALLSHLAGQYDILVIDSAPALVASDPLVLARQADGVLLVVGAGATRARLVRQAVAAIRQVGGQVLGVVLNRVADADGPRYYAAYEVDPVRTVVPEPAGAGTPADSARAGTGEPLRLG